MTTTVVWDLICHEQSPLLYNYVYLLHTKQITLKERAPQSFIPADPSCSCHNDRAQHLRPFINSSPETGPSYPVIVDLLS